MIAKKLAHFIAAQHLANMSDSVCGQAKMAILDWLAALVLGVAEDRAAIDPLLNVVTQLGGGGDASIIGLNRKTSMAWAALVNGYNGHLLDYDETTPPVRSHLTACVLPAVLALGEAQKCSGAQLLEAYIIGYEVALRVGEAMTPGWMKEGWHGTPLFGIFGAIAGCAKLIGLDVEATANALGMACSMAGGIVDNFGTMTKPFHAGQAAKNAVLGSLLAEEGFTAGGHAMEGFFKSHAWSNPANLDIFAKLGNPWGLETNGNINPKLYPCCHGLATTIEYGIRFKEQQIASDDIAEVCIYGIPRALSAMHSTIYADNGEALDWHYDGPPRQLAPGIPTTGKEAKFSQEYGFAVALLYGAPTSCDFTDAAIRRPEVQSLMQRVKVFHDSELDKTSYQYPEADWPYGERFEIVLTDGRTLREEQIFVLGAARRPLSMAHVKDKFRICTATAGFTPKRAAQLINDVEEIESFDDLHIFLGKFNPVSDDPN